MTTKNVATEKLNLEYYLFNRTRLDLHDSKKILIIEIISIDVLTNKSVNCNYSNYRVRFWTNFLI